VCLYVIIILLHDLTLLRCKTCAIDIGSLKATYLLTYLQFDHHWCKIMLQQLNVVGDSCESTLVLKRKADVSSTSYGISIYQWHSDIFVDVC